MYDKYWLYWKYAFIFGYISGYKNTSPVFVPSVKKWKDENLNGLFYCHKCVQFALIVKILTKTHDNNIMKKTKITHKDAQGYVKTFIYVYQCHSAHVFFTLCKCFLTGIAFLYFPLLSKGNSTPWVTSSFRNFCTKSCKWNLRCIHVMWTSQEHTIIKKSYTLLRQWECRSLVSGRKEKNNNNNTFNICQMGSHIQILRNFWHV